MDPTCHPEGTIYVCRRRNTRSSRGMCGACAQLSSTRYSCMLVLWLDFMQVSMTTCGIGTPYIAVWGPDQASLLHASHQYAFTRTSKEAISACKPRHRFELTNLKVTRGEINFNGMLWQRYRSSDGGPQAVTSKHPYQRTYEATAIQWFRASDILNTIFFGHASINKSFLHGVHHGSSA